MCVCIDLIKLLTIVIEKKTETDSNIKKMTMMIRIFEQQQQQKELK